MTTAGAQWFRGLLLAASLVTFLLYGSFAEAAGRLEWKSKSVDERAGGSWQIEVSVYMPKPPDVAHVPMRFSFTPTVYYERTMVDGKSDPVLRKVPLQNKQPLIESVDIGFLDPGSGQIQSRTRFSFKVTRGHGYEAGEYQVKVTDSRNNSTVGTPVTLVFNGENEIIDRRSIVFSGEKKKKKDADEDTERSTETESASSSSSVSEDDEDYWKGGPTEEAQGPPAEKKKPGGCGCRLGGEEGPSHSAALLTLLCLLVFGVRRARA